MKPACARLHQHAWWSIFSFSDLATLNSILCAHKAWKSMISTMSRQNLEIRIPTESISDICQSVLGRHIGNLFLSEMSRPKWLLVSQKMSHVGILSVHANKSFIMNLSMFTKLSELWLGFEKNDNLDATQRQLDHVKWMSSLKHLRIWFNPMHSKDISFACLSACIHLECLHLGNLHLTSTHAHELNLVPNLNMLSFFQSQRHDTLAVLVAGGCNRGLTGLYHIAVRSLEDSASVAALSQLESISLDGLERCAFLHKLTQLHTFEVSNFNSCRPEVFLPAIATRASSLKILCLRGSSWIDASHVTEILSQTTCLTDLELGFLPAVSTLVFLSCKSLQKSNLTKLFLESLGGNDKLPHTELCHLNKLRKLQIVYIAQNVFSEPFTEFMMQLYQHPSLLLPDLVTFSVE
jgi:hypothetical protein